MNIGYFGSLHNMVMMTLQNDGFMTGKCQEMVLLKNRVVNGHMLKMAANGWKLVFWVLMYEMSLLQFYL